jgi:antitoxin component YwqK of YwqJK toxin-antitoxin module
MQTLIEELLDYEYTPFSIHTSMRVIDPHLNTKNWIPKIIIETSIGLLNMLIKKTLINGELHGPYVGRWDNGQKWIESNYINKELHGPFKKWYRNGQKWIECEFVNEELHGPYKKWYENGHPSEECNFVDGIQILKK